MQNSGVTCYVDPTVTGDSIREVYLSVRVKAQMSHLNSGISKNPVQPRTVGEEEKMGNVYFLTI